MEAPGISVIIGDTTNLSPYGMKVLLMTRMMYLTYGSVHPAMQWLCSMSWTEKPGLIVTIPSKWSDTHNMKSLKTPLHEIQGIQ